MFRKILQIMLISGLLLSSTGVSAGPLRPQLSPDGSNELTSVLKSIGDYCEKIKLVSLYYICREEITKTEFAYWVNHSAYSRNYSYGLRSKKRKKYLYDYQLIRKSGTLFERRNQLEVNGKKKVVQDASIEGIKYVGKFQVFGPVGFFSRDWQNFFDYQIEKKEDLFGKNCLVLSAVPKTRMKINQNTARIWIDESNRQILKIEWEPCSIQNYDAEPLRGPLGEMRKRVIWSTEYQFENKGIRFPSRQTVREFYIDRKNTQLLRIEIIYQYSGYQFFTVEVEINIKDDGIN